MRATIAITTALLAGGCATSQVELLSKQVTDLQREISDMRKGQAAFSVAQEDMETRLFLVQDAVDTASRNGRLRAMQAEPELTTVKLQPQNGPESVFDPSADSRVAVRPDPGPLKWDQLSDTGEKIPTEGTSGPATAPTPRSKRAPVPAADRDAVALYKESFELVKQKKYSQAIEGFERFIERFPTHGYADNALYWMGESYYDRALWMKALSTFQSVIQSYPLGNKAPDAMLKLGLCHYQLRNVRQAREVLVQVTEIYPKSPVARIARAKLEKLQ